MLLPLGDEVDGKSTTNTNNRTNRSFHVLGQEVGGRQRLWPLSSKKSTPTLPGWTERVLGLWFTYHSEARYGA